MDDRNGIKKKISIIIPVYFNQDNLKILFEELKRSVLSSDKYYFEIVMVDDGSNDDSYKIMRELKEKDDRIKIIKLSRNFGSHSAILCGFNNCTGDCAIVKAADLQEPTQLILDMVSSWEEGNNVVLAIRKDREEAKSQVVFSNFYYWLVRKFALKNMPKKGFDIYLIDRKVIEVLKAMDEPNSALTAQILWSGFKTSQVEYVRKAREIGKSKWTLKKKINLVKDTLFNFTNLPITIVLVVGTLSFVISIIWSFYVLLNKIFGNISVSGFTTLFIFNLASFGIIMMTLGILGEYLWRTFDASKKRPVYIIEEKND